MSFFDSKEEVINIELTQYGRYLLSKGKFKPSFYAFYDDDVVYDSQFIQITENQNSIQTRILNETPLLKPNYSFTSVENSVVERSETLLAKEDLVSLKRVEIEGIPSLETNASLLFPLGKSASNSEFYPSWSIQLISGTISSSTNFIDNTSADEQYVQPYLQIPQLNLNTGSYSISAVDNKSKISGSKEILEEFKPNGADNNETFYLLGEKRNLTSVIEFLENNVDQIKENFELEVFVEEEKTLSNGTTKKVWKKLCFLKEQTNIRTISDGKFILLDEPVGAPITDLVPTENNVEYYLTINTDDAIELPIDTKISLADIYNTEITDADKPFGENC